MANIRVHLLNSYSMDFSHMDVVLENLSPKIHTFYCIDRWETPRATWGRKDLEGYVKEADFVCSFDIVADPAEITKRWKKYREDTSENARLLGENCATAGQWFLSEFADIPKPDLFSNVSLDYLGLGVVWPSFIPCFVTLPGRVLSNAKFHVEAKNNPEISTQYSCLLLCIKMSLAVLAFAASVILSIAIVLPLVIVMLSADFIARTTIDGIHSMHRFFKAKSSPKESVSDKSFRGAESQQSNDRTPLLAA